MLLTTLGWNSSFARYFQQYRKQGLFPARVAGEYKHVYLLYSERGGLNGQVSGRIRHTARSPHDFPAVGDWVALQLNPGQSQATIQNILPRSSKFVQVSGGSSSERIVAANVDTVLLVSSLGQGFRPRYVEDCLTLAWESGANPVIVLTKADLCPNVEVRLADVAAVAFGVPIHAVSAATSQGMEQLYQYAGPGQTLACLGPQGVGKTTLINSLLGQETRGSQPAVSETIDGERPIIKRELIFLPSGGVIVDNPGLRGLTPGGAEGAFEDVEALAAMCRFRDCTHQREPGCAVRQALENGQLDYSRFKSYLRQHKDLLDTPPQQDERRQQAERLKQEKLIRSSRRMKEQDIG